MLCHACFTFSTTCYISAPSWRMINENFLLNAPKEKEPKRERNGNARTNRFLLLLNILIIPKFLLIRVSFILCSLCSILIRFGNSYNFFPSTPAYHLHQIYLLEGNADGQLGFPSQKRIFNFYHTNWWTHPTTS